MSTTKTERGICELYAEDPERADALVFGRVACKGRRGFLKGAGLAAMGAVLGAAIPFHRNMPAGLIPAALADTKKAFQIQGKDGLVVLNDRPLNAETPAHLLDDRVTPIERHFIRNNGLIPEKTDPQGWTITIDGEVNTPMKLTLDELKSKFKAVTLQLQLECAGNGRAFFNPPARGNQWTVGAVGCSEWTGVRLRDVLKAAGVKPSAVYTGHYGADPDISGKADVIPLSRGGPIAKMMDPNTLIAFAMNGKAIHAANGAPVRLVVPGFPGSVSQKWLTRVWVRDKVHDGPKMTGMSYKMPKYPVAPGQKVPVEDFEIMAEMPVKSLITFPETKAKVSGMTTQVRGHAWSGMGDIADLVLSFDFGVSWIKADLEKPRNRYAWQHWTATLAFPQKGYYEIWAKATDAKGRTQPFAVAWNPRGYGANVMHRVAVTVV